MKSVPSRTAGCHRFVGGFLTASLSFAFAPMAQQGAESKPATDPVAGSTQHFPSGAAGKFGGRLGGRKGLAKGGALSATAIAEALEWLKVHQDLDGRWDAEGFAKHDPAADRCDGAGVPNHDVGVSALTILAFLGDGSTTASGPYAQTLKKGCAWLVKQQRADGVLGSATTSDFIYDHVLATYALCEAAGLSGDEAWRKPAQSGIDYLEAHRNPYAVWGLAPRDNRSDTSVTCWAVMAYKSASDFKFKVNNQAFKLAETWLDQVTDADGIVGLQKRGDATDSRPIDAARLFGLETKERLTAAGLLARFFLGQDPKQVPLMFKSADVVLTAPPRDGSFDPLACYWSSYALYQVGGRHWATWSKSLTEAIVKNQRTDGTAAGSWDSPESAKGFGGGRVMSTALAALTIEAYYRYTRLVR